MPDVLLIAIIAGLLAIDDRAGWQSLLGEPIFSALIVGAILGTVGPALKCGVVLQLACLSIGAARGTRRPNTVVGGVVGAGATSLVLAQTGDPRETVVIASGVFMGLLAGEAGAVIARAAGEFRERWLGNFRLPEMPPGSYETASRNLVFTSIGAALLVGLVDFVTTLVLLPVAAGFTEMVGARLGADAASGAVWWLGCVSAIGVAAMARAFSTRALVRFLVLGGVAVAVVGWLR